MGEATQWWANLERFIGLAQRSHNADTITIAEGDGPVSPRHFYCAVPVQVAEKAEKREVSHIN